MPSLKEIADELIAANRESRVAGLLDTYYADDAVSVEAGEMTPGEGREKRGLDAIRGKHAWWAENMTEHSFEVEGPFPHGDDRFAVIYDADVTVKETGERMKMREIGVYHVADGKIVREEFFYPTGG